MLGLLLNLNLLCFSSGKLFCVLVVSSLKAARVGSFAVARAALVDSPGTLTTVAVKMVTAVPPRIRGRAVEEAARVGE